MKHPLILLASVLALSACNPPPMGGGGTLSDGKPVSGLLSLHQPTKQFTAQIISPEGWTCTSDPSDPEDANKWVLSMPLHCTNGATGQVVLTLNSVHGQITGTFSLSNGKSGQVIFGKL